MFTGRAYGYDNDTQNPWSYGKYSMLACRSNEVLNIYAKTTKGILPLHWNHRANKYLSS